MRSQIGAREELRLCWQIEAREARCRDNQPNVVPFGYGVIDAAPGFAYHQTADMCERDPSWMIRERPELQKLVIAPVVVEAVAPPPPPLTVVEAVASPPLSLLNPDGVANESNSFFDISSSSKISGGQTPRSANASIVRVGNCPGAGRIGCTMTCASDPVICDCNSYMTHAERVEALDRQNENRKELEFLADLNKRIDEVGGDENIAHLGGC
jgi:hypothetical protein